MKLTSIKVRHFKALEDSGTIKLGPLTAFFGYNGTGKRSLIEACEIFQARLMPTMDWRQRWRLGDRFKAPDWQ
jgi:AAA15 family ATPase/GTPase